MKFAGRRLFVMLSAAIFAVTCLGFGSVGTRKSSERKTNVTFTTTTKLQNGTSLRAGTYQMEFHENTQTPKVTFYQNGKAVATVAAKLENNPQKTENTEVDTVKKGSSEELTSIRPSGEHQKLVFDTGGK